MFGKKVVVVVGGSITGKGEVVDVLKAQGYIAFSGGDMLREIATEKGISHERPALTELSQKLRTEHGGDYLIRESMRRMNESEGDKFVFESIRNPAEVTPLRDSGALVVGVETPDEKRLELSLLRKRPGDPKTLEEVIALREREANDGQGEFGQNVDGCMALADVIIPNTSTLDVFHQSVIAELTSRGYIEGQAKRVEREI